MSNFNFNPDSANPGSVYYVDTPGGVFQYVVVANGPDRLVDVRPAGSRMGPFAKVQGAGF